LAIVDRELLMYDHAPVTRDDWAAPMISFQILSSRLVERKDKELTPSGDETLTFSLRSGTRQGVTEHKFRVELRQDLVDWTNAFATIISSSVSSMKELSTAVTWQNKKCLLTLHHENGFSLINANDAVTVPRPREASVPQQLLWFYPFEQLRRSDDDCNNRVWLDFGKYGQQELDLGMNPKPFVFILLSFLAAKVARLHFV